VAALPILPLVEVVAAMATAITVPLWRCTHHSNASRRIGGVHAAQPFRPDNATLGQQYAQLQRAVAAERISRLRGASRYQSSQR